MTVNVRAPAPAAVAIDGLFSQHGLAVLGYLSRRAPRGTARELAADTFLVAWRRIHEQPRDPLPWLLSIARRLLANKDRSHAYPVRLPPHASTAVLDISASAVVWGVSPENVARAAIVSLPEDDRDVLTLTAWEGLTHQQVCRVLGFTSVGYRMRLRGARKRFVRALAGAVGAGRRGFLRDATTFSVPHIDEAIERANPLPPAESDASIPREAPAVRERLRHLGPDAGTARWLEDIVAQQVRRWPQHLKGIAAAAAAVLLVVAIVFWAFPSEHMEPETARLGADTATSSTAVPSTEPTASAPETAVPTTRPSGTVTTTPESEPVPESAGEPKASSLDIEWPGGAFFDVSAAAGAFEPGASLTESFDGAVWGTSTAAADGSVHFVMGWVDADEPAPGCHQIVVADTRGNTGTGQVCLPTTDGDEQGES